MPNWSRTKPLRLVADDSADAPGMAAARRSHARIDTRYRELILAYCRRRGLQPKDANEVRRQVMIRLARITPGARSGQLRAFLRRSVDHAVQRKLTEGRLPRQQAGVETVRGMGVALPGAGPGAADNLDALWHEEWIRHHHRCALHALRRSHDPMAVRVFERLLAGGDVEEIAELFGISPSVVQRVGHRLRSRLRSLIARQIRSE